VDSHDDDERKPIHKHYYVRDDDVERADMYNIITSLPFSDPVSGYDHPPLPSPKSSEYDYDFHVGTYTR